MTVMRVDHSQGGWVAVPVATVEDGRLDADTIGVLVFLLVKPTNWQIRPEVLKNHFQFGRQAWARITAQLIECGYYTRVVARDAKGRLSTDIVVTPVPASGQTEASQVVPIVVPQASPGKLFDLATQNGLSAAAARRFVKAAAGAADDQIEALQHELPLRLSTASDRTAVAIKLAQLSANGELDDSTRDTREAAALAARRRVEESIRHELEKQRADKAAAQRAQHGPSPGELACRALSQKFKGHRNESPRTKN